MFELASKLRLRFTTSQGTLNVEDLWDLSMIRLATMVKNLKKTLKVDTDDELAFLDEKAPQVNKEDQLRFDIVKHIYLIKKEEATKAKDAKALKERKEYLMSLIAEKQDEVTKGKSLEELQAELALLD